MKGEKLELARGSGKVFRDLGRENADLEHLKALLAAEIIKAHDRAAHARTGFARGRLLAHPERRAREVHDGPIDVDSEPSRFARGGKDPSVAARKGANPGSVARLSKSFVVKQGRFPHLIALGIYVAVPAIFDRDEPRMELADEG
jgi:hypothetical protein